MLLQNLAELYHGLLYSPIEGRLMNMTAFMKPTGNDMIVTTDWQAQLPEILDELAAEKTCISYRDLADRLAVPAPLRIRQTANALDQVIRADHATGRPLRAAVVISACNTGLPARGFFQTCAEIGRYFGPENGPQAAFFHALELRRLFAEYAD